MRFDKVTILPSLPAGVLSAPPSKSNAHRKLICAGLGKGTSVIHNVDLSEDVKATISCLETIGAEVTAKEGRVTVTGADPAARKETVFRCSESGSTLRFFLPPALLSEQPAEFVCAPGLMKRPLEEYERICAERGISFIKQEDRYRVCGTLAPGEYTVNGGVSSQYISGLLFALPLLDGDSVIRILEPFSSKPYVLMTLDTMRAFGVPADLGTDGTIRVHGKQRYEARECAVEGDCSNAAFLDALNYCGGSVKVTGIFEGTLQGDRVYKEFFPRIEAGRPVIDLHDCPDLGPVCMALAAAKNGGVFQGTSRLRVKESDRCAAMAEELAKFGVACRIEEDCMTVYGGDLKKPGKPLFGHNDHRICMALSLLCVMTGGSIEGCRAVNKSYPGFFDDLKKTGVRVIEYGMDQ